MPFTPLLYQLFLCEVYLKYESQRMRMANKGGRILWRRKKESVTVYGTARHNPWKTRRKRDGVCYSSAALHFCRREGESVTVFGTARHNL